MIKVKLFLLKCKFEKFDSLTATTLYRCPGCIWLCNHCQRTKTPHSRLTPWEDLTLKTLGYTWMHSHHCSYLSPGAKAPDHQYSQCWLNSRCTETVSYKNITLMVNNIRKYSGINTCMLLVSGLWLCKHSRQLHSPSLVAIGRSVGYETWPPILYWMALHFCNWLV